MRADGGRGKAEGTVPLPGPSQHLHAVPGELSQLGQRRLVGLVTVDHLVLRGSDVGRVSVCGGGGGRLGQ